MTFDDQTPMPSDATAMGLLAVAPIAALLVDADDVIRWGNPAAATLLAGGDADAMVGRLLDDAVSFDVVETRRHTPVEQLLVRVRRPAPGTDDLVGMRSTELDDGRLLLQFVDAPREDDETHLQREFRTALMELGQLSDDHIDEEHFFDVFMRRAVEVIPGAQGGSVLRRDPRTNEFHFVAAEGFDLDRLRERTIAGAEMLNGVDDPVASISYEIDTSQLDPTKLDWMQTAGRVDEIRTSVSVPVISAGETLAFLNLNNFEDRSAFDGTAVEMTTLLGRLVADLFRRRHLEEELRAERESYRHLAHHDALTGLANRRHVETALADAVEETESAHTPMATLFVDLDDFKQINDQLGHDIGDRVLVATADALRLAARRRDVVGRWGGDEFVMVAPDVPTPEDARRLAERVLEHVGGEIQLPDGQTVTCRLSVGVAWTSDGSGGPDLLLRHADEALYRAKNDGKSTLHLHAA